MYAQTVHHTQQRPEEPSAVESNPCNTLTIKTTAALRRMDQGIRLRKANRSTAGPALPPRPHPGDERRDLPPQAQPGEHRVPSSGQFRRRKDITINALSSCSCNAATLPDLLPPIIMSVAHHSAAPMVRFLGALDTQCITGHRVPVVAQEKTPPLSGRRVPVQQVPA